MTWARCRIDFRFMEPSPPVRWLRPGVSFVDRFSNQNRHTRFVRLIQVRKLFLKGPKMGKKLYVGNLSYSVNDDSLQQHFSEFGTISSAKVMMDRDSGRSKGFGFVEMSSDAEAQAAISGMNGKSVDGRDMVVNEARPMEPRTGGFGGGGGGRREGGGGGYGGGGGGGGGYGGGRNNY